MNGQEQLYLLKIGELILKGDNRGLYEKQLRDNIRSRLSDCSPQFVTQMGRMFLRVTPDCPPQRVEALLAATAGLTGYARAFSAEKSIDAVTSAVLEALRESGSFERDTTFKVEARRADKSFPLTSYEICCAVGDAVTAEYPRAQVQVRKPELQINVEIRNRAYVYVSSMKGIGGLPVGTSGKGLLLLSGGIDSPVAGYRMAVRGMQLDALYFHTYPYTSDEALNKVKSIAARLSDFIPGLSLYVVPFTEVQLAINRACDPEERVLIMRYAMIRIADAVAGRTSAQALITGESLSQVASQTVESLTFTESASTRIVLRPLIGLDKEQITAAAVSIGTYETSILPYDDCCAVFSAEHPITKPDKKEMTRRFHSFKLDSLIEDAVEKTTANGKMPLD
jgi:tRNA uracil 4-sulfurtransferase